MTKRVSLLRYRLVTGQIEELFDPELPLMLLANPDPVWWQQVREHMVKQLLRGYQSFLPYRVFARLKPDNAASLPVTHTKLHFEQSVRTVSLYLPCTLAMVESVRDAVPYRRRERMPRVAVLDLAVAVLRQFEPEPGDGR